MGSGGSTIPSEGGSTVKNGEPVHIKPGGGFSYADSEAYAKHMGGRLLTLQEARTLMNGKALYPGEDQWCAVQGRDWVQVGDKIHHPGKSHNVDCGGYPPWGDDKNNNTYGTPTWNHVALYAPGLGTGASQQQDSVVTLSGFCGYNSRLNGEYTRNGESVNGKPVYTHMPTEGVGAGMDWCRMWYAHGAWRIGHMAWIRGDNALAVAYCKSPAALPCQIDPSTEWMEHKGTGAGKDYGKDERDFKSAGKVIVCGDHGSLPAGTGGGSGLTKVEVGHVMSWFGYRDRAVQEGGRLPTTAELASAGIDVGYDQWTPIMSSEGDRETGRRDGIRDHGQNAWANIGPRKYMIEYPAWGLDASTHPWKALTYFYVAGDASGVAAAEAAAHSYLLPWLLELGMIDRFVDIASWCEEEGATSVEEVVAVLDLLLGAVKFTDVQTKRMNMKAQDAMKATLQTKELRYEEALAEATKRLEARLEEFVEELKLTRHSKALREFCIRWGISCKEELFENLDRLKEAIEFGALEIRRLEQAAGDRKHSEANSFDNNLSNQEQEQENNTPGTNRIDADAASLPLPSSWKNQDVSKPFFCLEPANGIQDVVQEMMNATFKAVSTRDRKDGDVPTKLQVVTVQRIENSRLWQQFTAERQRMLAKRPSGCTQLSKLRGGDALTISEEAGGMRTVSHPLDARINETILWHGTSPAGALGIAEHGFDLGRAGSGAGSMYGPGVYLAECSSKSDEYSEVSEGGLTSGLYCLLLCRVALGELLSLTTGGDAVHGMIKSAFDSEAYDSVLGDREACRGTYREFVAPKAEQVMPMYVVVYRRES
eukprot:TRINITY_DN10421_c0_g3_i2.p1 TRINITY_DN10421_c0_g3~~TRINITY_DN10421_c0_g3_i2.p1  ORF type:complete len:822 (+),score=142.96 TRINITY_DN10421_c0_g3_i2:55-2520(+)